jgi:uncharacterized metal-binding protein YceD (DUF177 family)
MSESQDPIWRVPVRINEIPAGGRHLDLHADGARREAIARMMGLEALPRLDASFDISRLGGRVRVQGTVSARVRQTCVVTLEPIESEIHEPVDVVFAPGIPSGVRSEEGLPGVEVAIAADDAPEPLEGESIDLGEIATEHLILGIDPYPRKPGAVFAAPASPPDAENPFAALAGLKKDQAEQ